MSGGDQVQVLSPKAHALHRPDMYLGRIEPIDMCELTFVTDESAAPKVKTCIARASCSPALLKLVDELVTNALDNSRRCASQHHIKLLVTQAGEIEVWNDGDTLSVKCFESSKAYIPEVVFSWMFSGTNFDDSDAGQVRTGAGRNGLGAKICNIFASRFEVHLVNAEEGMEYKQVFEGNMSVIGKPSVRKSARKKSFTCVRFMPDYARLGMRSAAERGLDDGVLRILQSRAYDAAVCAPSHVAVSLNDKKLPMQNIQQYIRSIVLGAESGGNGDEKGAPVGIAFDKVEDSKGERVFEVCVTASPDMNALLMSSSSDTSGVDAAAAAATLSFSPFIAFVNGVRCSTGSHANMILRKVSELVLDTARTRSKNKDIQLKPAFVKKHALIVANLIIPNPRFASQLKDSLDTPVTRFGFTWTPSASFRSALDRSPLVERALSEASKEEDKQLQRETKATCMRTPRIENYDAATELGRRKDCALILTEGLSAKALCIAGLTAIPTGRKRFGVFPLKGKLMNASKFSMKRAMTNAEISNLTSILGLQYGVNYETDDAAVRRLPYANVLIFTDADTDGDHIAGLIMNFLHEYYPSLLAKFPRYVQRFATPILQVTLRGGVQHGFFSVQEYREWAAANPELAAHVVKQKYYKGLGTSSNAEAKRYFSNMGHHMTTMRFTGEPCTRTMRLFFHDQMANDRKQFLMRDYDPESFVDYTQPSTTMQSFLVNGLAHFSHYNNQRSLPHAIDGLKVSQRKVMFVMLERKQEQEIKIAQAGSIVAERTEYHHGEVSLVECIVSLSQDHVGSNNVALLHGVGQVGSRHNKNSVHAAPRYIYTQLNANLTRKIFPAEDDPVLEYVEQEGRKIEPKNFVPVVPVVLCNGADGIGTGWSTNLPPFNPLEVVDYCTTLCQGVQPIPPPSMIPWYAGFTGSVIPQEAKASSGEVVEGKQADAAYRIRGIATCNVDEGIIQVEELPIGFCTESFLNFVRDKLTASSAKDATQKMFVRHVENLSTDTRVRVTLHCFKEHMPRDEDGVYKALKLETTTSLSNVHLFDASGKLKFYTVKDIFTDHAVARLDLYEKRRHHLISKAEHELCIVQNKIRFIKEVNNRDVQLHTMSSAQVHSLLEERGYAALPSFAYLLDMRMSSMTTDRIESLEKAAAKLQEDVDALRKTTAQHMWISELSSLRDALVLYYDEQKRACDAISTSSAEKETVGKAATKKRTLGDAAATSARKQPASAKATQKKQSPLVFSPLSIVNKDDANKNEGVPTADVGDDAVM